jgi:hypothetical protein
MNKLQLDNLCLTGREWKIFFDKKMKGVKSDISAWFSKQTKVYTFKRADDFWRIMNNIRPIGSLPDFTDFYCFNADFHKPEWETVQGGEWRFVMDRNNNNIKHQELATGIFIQITLSCIGEYFTHADLICGFVVTYRHLAKYALWTKYMTEEQAIKTGQELKQLFFQPRLKYGLEYVYHYELLTFGKPKRRFILS